MHVDGKRGGGGSRSGGRSTDGSANITLAAMQADGAATEAAVLCAPSNGPTTTTPQTQIAVQKSLQDQTS